MTQTVQQAQRDGARVLERAGIGSAARDAALLMAHVLGTDVGRLILMAHDQIAPPTQDAFSTAISRRASREPVSHILGYRDFYQGRFIVSPDVLDPRPATETLIEAALAEPFQTVLDLGTGSGAIVISLLAQISGAQGVGTDISSDALNIAAENADAQGVKDRITLIRSDWFGAITGRFDLIVSNPPYIAATEMPALAPELTHEPRIALTDEADGLSAYRAICAAACDHLRPNGRLIVEIGSSQGQAVCDLFARAGLGQINLRKDLDGRDRVVCGRKPA